jgi:hypothetical protein
MVPWFRNQSIKRNCSICVSWSISETFIIWHIFQLQRHVFKKVDAYVRPHLNGFLTIAD